MYKQKNISFTNIANKTCNLGVCFTHVYIHHIPQTDHKWDRTNRNKCNSPHFHYKTTQNKLQHGTEEFGVTNND